MTRGRLLSGRGQAPLRTQAAIGLATFRVLEFAQPLIKGTVAEVVGPVGIVIYLTLNMASTKDSRLIEILHNEWCMANGYPVRKRTSFRPGRPQVERSSNGNQTPKLLQEAEGTSPQAEKLTS